MPRFIAFYLPQYHPTKENDAWWGKGFTEWTNVAKAKPLYRGHYQPKIPRDLGFYDLRLPEVREEQVKLAMEAGIEGFCYWHYWFGNGKRILERPFQEVLNTGKPDFPFCLGWANESWTNKSWTNKSSLVRSGILLEQTYNVKDYENHFYSLLPAFKDKRYIRVDGKPLFYVYRPFNLPNIREFVDLWQFLAKKNGLDGLHLVAMSSNVSFRKVDDTGKRKYSLPSIENGSGQINFLLNNGFDAVNLRGHAGARMKIEGRLSFFIQTIFATFFDMIRVKKANLSKMNEVLFSGLDKLENVYPTILPNWDRTPRAGRKDVIYTHSTPDVFEKVADRAIKIVSSKKEEHQIIFIQSWNEWGEGNYMEPDIVYGKGFINALRNAIIKNKNGR